MTKAVKLSVGLTRQLSETVRGAVASGEYASTGDVFREAISEWAAQRERHAARLAELKAGCRRAATAARLNRAARSMDRLKACNPYRSSRRRPGPRS